MSHWGRKIYQSWPSRHPVWTISAFFGAVLFFLLALSMQYARSWSFVERNGYSTAQNNGNVLSQSLTVPGMGAVNTVYTYDGVNRLSVAAENSSNPSSPPCPDASSQWCRQYNYYSGGYGNRKTAQNSGQGVSPLEPGSFNSNNQIADTGWSYTEANSVQRGNVTQQKGGATFAYDGENRQTAYCPNDSIPANCTQTAGNGRTLYYYDGQGRRVMTQEPTGTTVYVYDVAGNLAAEYASQPPAALCTTCYLTADHLGSTRVMTDQNGCAVFREDYLPFGETILPLSGSPRLNGTGGTVCATNGYQASTNPRLLFGGEPLDNATGLDYFESRYFSAAQGRFTSPDEPFAGWNQQNPQSWNLYSYGLNNPLRYVDPDGHDPCVNGINPETGNICTVVTAQKSKAAPPPDVVLDSPLFFAVARGVQQAKPGVDLAGAGLVTFFSFVAPFTSAATQCIAGNCDKTNRAMAVIPGGAEEQAVAKFTRWGWTGTKKFLTAIRVLKSPGTHEALEGIVPTLEEAKQLIQKAGGTIDRIEEGHAVGGVSEHTYPHVNYTTPSGAKATVRVESIGK